MENISIREVGLRDGLQLLNDILPTAIKIKWVAGQSACGFRDMEVTSMVPATLLPQFADAVEVLTAARAIPSLTAAVLVPNLKWGITALEQGAQKISFVLSVSEAHNQANVRRTTDESMAEFKQLVVERDNRGLRDRVLLSAAMATTFGCSLQGAVIESRVYAVAENLLTAGADELNMADTVGYANPRQVKRILTQVIELAGASKVAAHFHDTRGMGLANVVAAVDVDVRRFDASLGGLGGCPFAKGASGNIASEDCIYLLEEMGFTTGVDLSGLLSLRQQLGEWLSNEPLQGKLLKAGLAKTFKGQKTWD